MTVRRKFLGFIKIIFKKCLWEWPERLTRWAAESHRALSAGPAETVLAGKGQPLTTNRRGDTAG